MIYRVEPDVNPNAAVEYFDMNDLPGNPAGDGLPRGNRARLSAG